MFDKCFSFMYCSFCFGCVLLLNTFFLCFSFFFYNISNIPELIWSICLGVYYFIVIIFYLGLYGLIVKNSFDHVDKIVTLNYIQMNDSDDYKNDTKRIFKHILLNLIFLVISIMLNWFFDYTLVKIPLILYICWTLGFTASLRIDKNLSTKLGNDQLKDYILFKSVVNTSIFLILYFLIRYILDYI